MKRIEALEKLAQILLDGENKMLSTSELQTLIRSERNEEMKDFYIAIYNYLLGTRQKEVMARESY